MLTAELREAVCREVAGTEDEWVKVLCQVFHGSTVFERTREESKKDEGWTVSKREQEPVLVPDSDLRLREEVQDEGTVE